MPSAEICVTARPPRLETLETVEAPQLPGRMALRQHAQLAALPTRSLGERAFPHGKDPFYSRQGLQQFLQLFRDVYRYTSCTPCPAPLAEVYSSTAVYSGLQSTALQRSTVYSSLHSPSAVNGEGRMAGREARMEGGRGDTAHARARTSAAHHPATPGIPTASPPEDGPC